MTPDDLAAIRARAAAWEPLCHLVMRNGDPCGYVREHLFHRAVALGYPGHRYVYHPDADTSPEADRARLLAELDRLRGECDGCEGDGR